jgi:hypothetical protein
MRNLLEENDDLKNYIKDLESAVMELNDNYEVIIIIYYCYLIVKFIFLNLFSIAKIITISKN